MGRDKYGHYVNDKGVELRASTDKNGKDHIDIYDSCPADNKNHGSIHIDYDSNTGKGTIVDTTGGDKETTNIGCYLTTACMKHYSNNFDDNCYELTVLRWFRDNFVSAEDIDHYYKVAPYIVAGIDGDTNPNLVYDYIYDNIVDACVTAIENNDYEFAYNRYKNSILKLEEIYAQKVIQNKLIRTLKKQTI